jgi:hypothetical protein
VLLLIRPKRQAEVESTLELTRALVLELVRALALELTPARARELMRARAPARVPVLMQPSPSRAPSSLSSLSFSLPYVGVCPRPLLAVP